MYTMHVRMDRGFTAEGIWKALVTFLLKIYLNFFILLFDYLESNCNDFEIQIEKQKMKRVKITKLFSAVIIDGMPKKQSTEFNKAFDLWVRLLYVFLDPAMKSYLFFCLYGFFLLLSLPLLVWIG